MIQTLVMTSNKSVDLVEGFMLQYEKYFKAAVLDVVVCGYCDVSSAPSSYIIGDFADYPAHKWSDSLIKTLHEVADDVFILMLDDYWLVRQVDVKGVEILRDYMRQFQNVIKLDLTTDRLYADPGKYVYGYNTYNVAGHLDLIKSDFHSPYHMSLWGGIWRRDLLLKVLEPNESAQQIELNGTSRLAQYGDDLLVLGTRQSPMRHANVIQGGVWNNDPSVGLPALSEQDRKDLGVL